MKALKHEALQIHLIGFMFISYLSFGQDQKVADSLILIFQDEGLNVELKLEVLRNLAFNESDHIIAIDYAEELITLAKQNSSLIYEYRGYLQLGSKRWLLGELEEAMVSFVFAMEAAKKAEYLAGEGAVYSAIADLLSESSNYSKSLEYYRKAIKILVQVGDSLTLGTSILNAGDTHLTIGNCDSALVYFKESRKIFDQLDNKIGQAYTLGNTGIAYANLRKTELAEQNINQAIDILEETGDFYPICFYLLSMADIFRDRGDQKEALAYAERSLELAKQYQLKQQISDANLKLSELYEAQGKANRSLKHYKEYVAYRDSVTNLETVQKMADLRTEFEVSQKQHEVDQKENEILLLERKQELQRTYIIIAITLFLLSVAILLYLRQRLHTTRLRVTAEQKEHSDQVKDLLKTQETKALQAMVQGKEEERRHLAKELHNHLGSLLATVKVNLNGLDSQDQSKHQNIIGLVDQATQDVRNISHELNMGVSEGFGLIPALEELVSHLRHSNELDILLSTDLELVKIDSQNEILLYRIVQELISNVLKHAEATSLNISLTGFEEGNLINILVEDNGKGFDPDHLDSKNSGMGLSSLKEMIHQLDGEINIDSSPKGGTAISVDLAFAIPQNIIEA